MNALQGMDRYLKEVIQVSTWKNDINVQNLYDMLMTLPIPGVTDSSDLTGSTAHPWLKGVSNFMKSI